MARGLTARGVTCTEAQAVVRFRGKHRDPTPPPPPPPPLKMNVRDRLYQTSPRLDASNPTDIRGGTLRVGCPPAGGARSRRDGRQIGHWS